MPRTAHYWKASGKTACPDSFLFFDSETRPLPRPAGLPGEYHVLRLGCFLAYRYEKRRRTRVSDGVYRQSGAFWDAVSQRLSSDRPLWVMAHNIAFDLGTVDGWKDRKSVV